MLSILGIAYGLIKCDAAQNKLRSIISSYFWNNFLRFFTEGYLEMFFGALLNVASLTFSTYPEKISYVVSAVSLTLLVMFPFVSFALLYDNRKEIRDENEIYLKRYGNYVSRF